MHKLDYRVTNSYFNDFKVNLFLYLHLDISSVFFIYYAVFSIDDVEFFRETEIASCAANFIGYCWLKYLPGDFIISVRFLQGPRHGGGAPGARAPCSDPNSRDKGTQLAFGPLKLLKPKAHFTNWEGILIWIINWHNCPGRDQFQIHDIGSIFKQLPFLLLSRSVFSNYLTRFVICA